MSTAYISWCNKTLVFSLQLHTIAAYYPDAPTEEDKAAAEGLVKALRLLYPCMHCRAQLEVDLQRIPPRYENRKEFSLWMCEQHNAVNELLGKLCRPYN
jgi:FAD-linked sulfhydryl oxidase